MNGKRKRIVLPIEQKLKIIERLKKGDTCANIAHEYKIGETTVRDIKRSEQKIKDYVSKCDSIDGPTKRKTMKPSIFPCIDDAMSSWLSQKRAGGSPVDSAACVRQAKEFYKAFNMGGEFSTSTGWFARFKKRHGITDLTVPKQTPSADRRQADYFCDNFQDFVRLNHFTEDQIYTAEKTGLFWKCLPSKTLVTKEELKTLPGTELPKERVTFMCCSNSSGNHKLKLVVVGEAKKQHLLSLTKGNPLPVCYYSQKNVWLDNQILQDWFHKIFVPKVTGHLEKIGKPLKAVLLLDSAPTTPEEAPQLKSQDGLVSVMYVPPNISPLILPMSQGVVDSVKQHYRSDLLANLIKQENITQYWDKVTWIDTVKKLDGAWSSIKPSTLRRSWNNILGDFLPEEESETSTANTRISLPDKREPPTNETPFSPDLEQSNLLEAGKSDLEKWLNCDVEDRVFQNMTDEEILECVNNKEPHEFQLEDETLSTDHVDTLHRTDYLIEYTNNHKLDFNDRVAIKQITSNSAYNLNRSEKET